MKEKWDEPVLVLCDEEKEYALLMSEFLKKRKNLPWRIRVYTDSTELMRREEQRKITILVVSESVYSENCKKLRAERIVILNESGLVRYADYRNVDKYQAAEMVMRQLIEEYMDVAGKVFPGLETGKKTVFVGMYSPVHRCMQSSFALSMSQMLAEKHRTLYLNFEFFAGLSCLLPAAGDKDLSDLMYFLAGDREKFRLRMQTILRKLGKLEYIPPMRSGLNLLSIRGQEWLELIKRIGESGEYEFVILDLSDSIQGLLEILRCCKNVFTLTCEDRIGRAKLLQFEQLLSMRDFGDVLEKTWKCTMPQFHHLPEELEQYTKGDFADYVQSQMRILEEPE